MDTKLAYGPLTKKELEDAGPIFYGVLTNLRIMDTVDDCHLASMRCAVIVVQKKGELEAVVVRTQDAVTTEYPFEEIIGTISNYDTQKSVCIILVRDTAVCAVLVNRADFE